MTYCVLLSLYATTTSVLVLSIPLVCTYVVASLADTSIHPYDVLEAEPEVVSGYYVDYGGVAFMVIYLGEGMAIAMSLPSTYPLSYLSPT